MRLALFAALLLSTGTALAWDGPSLWYDPANGQGPVGAQGSLPPGGGGILGTGGATDYGITCAHCHTNDKQQQGNIGVTLSFSPAIQMTNGVEQYAPGTTYAVTARLTGERLGLSGCGSNVTGNLNNFAASFEDASGRPAGTLSSDSGQSQASCPQALPTATSGTTLLYGDCHAVFSISDNQHVGLTQWTFTWQAPPAGAGPITVSYAAVDGNCDMTSYGDDVKTGSRRFTEATASSGRRGPSPFAYALLALLPAIAAAVRRRRS